LAVITPEAEISCRHVVAQAAAGPSVRTVKPIDNALLFAAMPDESAGSDAAGVAESTDIGLPASNIPHAVSVRENVSSIPDPRCDAPRGQIGASALCSAPRPPVIFIRIKAGNC
jgi:hypothetical protein